MKIVMSGITRIVILTQNYAIKLPRVNYGWMKFVEGIYCNLSEAKNWKWDNQNERLCPTLFSFAGLINVMPRVKICTSEQEIKEIPNNEWTDWKPDNYGYYKGKLVCIDYPWRRIKIRNRIIKEE